MKTSPAQWSPGRRGLPPAALLALPFLLVMAILAAAVFLSATRGGEPEPPRAPVMDDADDPGAISVSDYLAALLINETPFPGEPAFKSAADSKNAMRAILWTIHNRRAPLPAGYTRWQVAATPSTNLVDILTAFKQMDGFFKDGDDRHTFAPRVAERMDYLRLLAQRDDTPTLSDLLEFAETTARGYAGGEPLPFPDPFVALTNLPPGAVDVTGSSYGWMTDDPAFHPGGNYIRIPDAFGGALGGNRFYTLRKSPLPAVEKSDPASAPPP